MLKTGVNFLAKQFLDTIFPIKCIGCNSEGEYLCDKCLKAIKLNKSHKCPRCGTENVNSSYCSECEITSKMEGMLISASYEDKLLQKTIHLLKYKLIEESARPLSKLLLDYIDDWLKFTELKREQLIFIPVPLHKKKYKFRGFNQTESLAKYLCVNTNLTYRNDILYRHRHTESQAKLNPIKRRKNIKNAFKIMSSLAEKDFSNNVFIILDDVCTTSATLEECAKTLSILKPAQIWGLVLAKGK